MAIYALEILLPVLILSFFSSLEFFISYINLERGALALYIDIGRFCKNFMLVLIVVFAVFVKELNEFVLQVIS